MNLETITNRMGAKRIVPVVVIDDVGLAVPLAEALLAGRLDVIEITLRTPAAERAIEMISQKFPEMLVGAGTILEEAQIPRVVAAGAQFGVAPGLNETIVRKAQACRLPFVPGVMTPSEVERALALGCKVLKFFPADAAGGVKMLKSIAAPYAHTGVKFIPLGGLNATNAAEYLTVPSVLALGGSWIVERKLIAERNWTAITKLTREALSLVTVVR
ncbi:MAG TPA: bifunctional 4-hydroxy-2-oxoglutarate aldolase/2-dehydro-3-deoxy-phosphogluconate aldolase [Verrucomicrobiae bacterium]|nr:bifunctional 4-hydroxy-2-oxoglutarate aldolase/2-dehydro-3-deoxy-phosphogluconate aldolase [Verrucomicrobiae bacterium]